jgi:cobalt-zinc-cadmium efflux system outer membrane protein
MQEPWIRMPRIEATMATRRHIRLLSTGLALAALSGCASTSIRADVARVRELSKVEALPGLPEARVDTKPTDDTRQLLDKPLDANAAVRVALLNNRPLRARLRELGVERGELIQAGLLKNPAIEAELSPERDTRLELRAEYDVMSFVLMPMHKKAAQHDLDSARFDAAGDVVELGYRVRSAFYALQASEQAYRVAQRSLDALAAGRDAAEALFEAGNLPQLDASSQIAAFERARITVAQLELEVAERKEAVQRLLGLHGALTQWSIVSELEPAPDEPSLAEDLEARALKVNLDLASTKQRLEAIAKRTGIARTEGWLPRIDVDVHSLIGNPDNSSRESVRWGGGVGIDVPLFDRQQGTLRAREAEFDSWLERYQGLAIDIRSAAREVSARVRSAHQRARQYQNVIVPAQNKVMEHTLLQYNAMQLGVFQLLDARRAQLEVALDYADTLREYWSAAAELDALLAGRVVGPAESAAAAAMPTAEASQGGH